MFEENQSKFIKNRNKGMKKKLPKRSNPKRDKYHRLNDCEIAFIVESKRLRD